MLLSRLESDCKYYLGNGNRYEKVLWAGSVDKQIAKMKELWNSFPDDMKPEWLSMEDIENYEKEMKKEVREENKKLKEAEETTNTISHELHTDLLPILNMYQYDIADGVEISREELNEVMQDKAMPIIEETIKTILPTAEVKAGKFYNPPYYRFGSGNNDQLDFTVTVPEADYEQLKAETISKEDFEDFLKEKYKSYDGFISYMPNTIKEFNEAEDWEQFVAVLSYYITPYEHQEEFDAEVQEYIWGNFPTEDDEDEYDDGDTNWAAEEEAEADERFEDRYMNGGNGFTADKKDESKEVLKETDADMYKRIKAEPRTENYNKGLKIRDEIVNAWKKGDLETAYKKWEELFDLFRTGYDDDGNTTDEWNNEQALRDMIELNMITDTIEDKCVYDVCDYGKQKAYKEMGY
jgi:predicted XRE-type DNA-binding protein